VPFSTASTAPAIVAEPVAAPAAPALRVVRKPELTPAARRRRTRLVFRAACLTAVCVAFSLVGLHVLSAQRQFALDRLQSQLSAAQAAYQDNRLAVAQANSPANIMAAAKRLGMREPASTRFIPGVAGAGSPTSPVGAAVPGASAPLGVTDWPSVKADLSDAP
jgi:cell division protein FtsL